MTISSTTAISTVKSSKETTLKSPCSVKPFYPPPLADLETPWTIKVYSAHQEQERWKAYNQAANASYAARKLQAVGEEQVIDIERYPTYFAEASLVGSNVPIGGVRIHLPDDFGRVPLLDELEGFTDTKRIQGMIHELRNEGVSHGGGLWIDPQYSRSGIAGDLARACNVMVILARSGHYIAATHQYSLTAWGSLGWHPMSAIPPFPYPDERYQTCVLFGTTQTWPTDLNSWASDQVGDSTLDGSGPRLTIEPMRVRS